MRRMASISWRHFRIGDAGLAQEDFKILVRILGSSNRAVVLTGANVLFHLANKNPRLAIDMLRHVNFQAHLDVLDHAFMVFHGERSPVMESLTAEDAAFLLSELKSAPELRGHWVEQLMSYLSRRFPVETLQFFIDRVELAARDDAMFRAMRPVNYGPWVHVPMRFRESDKAKLLMKMVWDWMTSHDTGNWRFEFNVPALFEAMFLPIDEAVIEFLSYKLKSSRKQDLRWIANVLSHADNNFVFAYPDFVRTFLDQCDRAGRPARQKGIDALLRSAISGLRSGIPGEPTPVDFDANARCAAILGRLPRHSGAHELYNSIIHFAQRNIQQARQDGEFLDDQ